MRSIEFVTAIVDGIGNSNRLFRAAARSHFHASNRLWRIRPILEHRRKQSRGVRSDDPLRGSSSRTRVDRTTLHENGLEIPKWRSSRTTQGSDTTTTRHAIRISSRMRTHRCPRHDSSPTALLPAGNPIEDRVLTHCGIRDADSHDEATLFGGYGENQICRNNRNVFSKNRAANIEACVAQAPPLCP